jgi:hypothetical protein
MLTPTDNLGGYSARDLQRCAEREANRVLTGRMTQAQADTEIRKMRAIAMHFAELAEKERLL